MDCSLEMSENISRKGQVDEDYDEKKRDRKVRIFAVVTCNSSAVLFDSTVIKQMLSVCVYLSLAPSYILATQDGLNEMV